LREIRCKAIGLSFNVSLFVNECEPLLGWLVDGVVGEKWLVLAFALFCAFSFVLLGVGCGGLLAALVLGGSSLVVTGCLLHCTLFCRGIRKGEEKSETSEKK
jgi:hypothetical protein